METGVEVIQAKAVFKAKETLAPERWESLIDDLKGIVTEHLTASREQIINMKWYLGDRLLEEGEEAITSVLTRVGVELHISHTELWRCLAFRKKFPSLDELWAMAPEGKNISWHKLVNSYIDFSIPKPEIPVEEKVDVFGLLKWWALHDDLHHLRLVDKEFEFTLSVKRDKAVIIVPEKHGNLRDIYKELTDFYMTLKKWEPTDMNRNSYNRIHHALKELLELAKFDKEKVKRSIKWCHDQYVGTKIDWGIETVVKKFAEASRPVKDYEKFMKKR